MKFTFFAVACLSVLTGETSAIKLQSDSALAVVDEVTLGTTDQFYDYGLS